MHCHVWVGPLAPAECFPFPSPSPTQRHKGRHKDTQAQRHTGTKTQRQTQRHKDTKKFLPRQNQASIGSRLNLSCFTLQSQQDKKRHTQTYHSHPPPLLGIPTPHDAYCCPLPPAAPSPTFRPGGIIPSHDPDRCPLPPAAPHPPDPEVLQTHMPWCRWLRRSWQHCWRRSRMCGEPCKACSPAAVWMKSNRSSSSSTWLMLRPEPRSSACWCRGRRRPL